MSDHPQNWGGVASDATVLLKKCNNIVRHADINRAEIQLNFSDTSMLISRRQEKVLI
jgi:hypothetical protein